MLLAEELSRCGVELVFLQVPLGRRRKTSFLVQFQGMIAEYEREQIAERSRRGKRHRAQQGLNVGVLLLWVSLCAEERHLGGLLPGPRIGGRGGAPGVRGVHAAGAEHQRHCTPAQRGAYSHPHREATRWERSTVWGIRATRRTGAGHASGRPNSAPGSVSPGGCGNARGWRAATVPTTNGLDRIGSRFRFRPLLATRLSPWRKSSWSRTDGILPGAPLNRPCCRGC